jgi:hypothetical protein
VDVDRFGPVLVYERRWFIEDTAVRAPFPWLLGSAAGLRGS